MRLSIGSRRHLNAQDPCSGCDHADNTDNNGLDNPPKLVIDLDPQKIERKKAQRIYYLNIVHIPILRLIGFCLVTICILLHNLFLLRTFSLISFAYIAVSIIAYSLISWVVLYAFFVRVQLLDLSLFFLVLDIFVWVAVIYLTGGENSLFFPLMMVRAADQSGTTFKRVLFFSHISILGYILMLCYLIYGEQRSISWAGELPKLIAIYAVNLYLSLAARTGEQARRRTRASVRIARDSILQLEEKSKQLAESKAQIERLSRQNELILSSAGEGIYGLDRQGYTIFVNPATGHMSGYSVEELLGRPVHPILHHSKPDGTPHPWEASPIFASLTTGAVHRVGDGVLWRKDGTRLSIQYMSTPICEDGTIIGVVVTFNDITERKRAQMALRQAHDELERRIRERTAALAKANADLRGEIAERQQAERVLREQHNLLQAIIEGTTDAVFVKDLQGHYLMINSAGARLLGRSVDEIMGKPDTTLFSRDTAHQIFKADRNIVHSGETQTYEEVGTAKGITRTYLTTKGAYRDHRGNIIGLFGMARDITERKHLEDQLRQSQKMEAIGRLAARLAHEVNNPLAIIKTAIRIIKNQSQADDPRIEGLQVIDEEISRIARIIQELFTFSRPTPTQDLVQMNAVIQNLKSLLAASLHEQRIALKATLEPELPLVRLSVDQLKQVLLNLVCNAADAMPHGGELVIRTACEGSSVEVSISDNGCGIPEEHLDRLFDPFFTTKERERGLGLGLSVSHEIIKAANGRIDVDSEVGKGSTFRVSLPAAAEPEGGMIDG
jgi:PAS domain S-box-containing protein